MIDVSVVFKYLDDYDKTLVNTALDWAIKNCHLYSVSESDERRTRSNTSLAKLKFEDENYSFPKDELVALDRALNYFHTELITRNISPYDENEKILDKMHISLKKITRKLEDFLFVDYQS